MVILAKAPVYKLRLGRPSRLPSIFINFEMDPHPCSSSQKHLFLVSTSLNQLCLDICSDIHAYPSQSNYVPITSAMWIQTACNRPMNDEWSVNLSLCTANKNNYHLFLAPDWEAIKINENHEKIQNFLTGHSTPCLFLFAVQSGKFKHGNFYGSFMGQLMDDLERTASTSQQVLCKLKMRPHFPSPTVLAESHPLVTQYRATSHQELTSEYVNLKGKSHLEVQLR